MNRFLAALNRLWFDPISPITLAVCRGLTGVYCFHYLYAHRGYLNRSAQSDPALFHPVGVARFLSEPLPPGVYDDILGISVVLAMAFTLGFMHRILAPLFATLMLFILSYSNSWTMVFHTENMLVVHVLILAITPSACALSLDAFYTKQSPGLTKLGMAPAKPEASLSFRWPLRLLQIGATLPYVVAGVAKVRGKAGWDWAGGDNLRDQITMNGLYYEVLMDGAEPITFHVYGWDWAFMLAATMTLVLELGAPFAILHRKIGYAFVAGIMGMHWSIIVLMGIPFPYQLYGWAFACFFVWDRPIESLGAKVNPYIEKLTQRFNSGADIEV